MSGTAHRQGAAPVFAVQAEEENARETPTVCRKSQRAGEGEPASEEEQVAISIKFCSKEQTEQGFKIHLCHCTGLVFKAIITWKTFALGVPAAPCGSFLSDT